MTYVPPIQDMDEFERTTLDLGRPAAPAGPYKTQFGAVPYRDRYLPHLGNHEWLIKNVLTRAEQGMLVGASQTGKSFLALDMGMAIARGVPWFGNKTRRGLVIYHAGESARGVRDKRMPAYDKAKGLTEVRDQPFVLLTLPLDLYSSDDDTNKIIVECQYWQKEYPDFPLELFVVDTWAAATPGADENAGKDVSGIRRRCKRIETVLGCAVLLVHHKNAQGTKARGHTSMFADVENVLDISLVTTAVGKELIPLKDVNSRKVREAVVTKLKDGEDGKKFRFVLEGVQLGTDEDGDPITSCVVAPPDLGDVPHDERGTTVSGKLPSNQYLLLKCIDQALKTEGVLPPPSDLKVSNSTTVVHWDYVRALFEAQYISTSKEDVKDPKSAFRKALSDNGIILMNKNYIRRQNPWVWRTSKRLPSEQPADQFAPMQSSGTSKAGADYAAEAFGDPALTDEGR